MNTHHEMKCPVTLGQGKQVLNLISQQGLNGNDVGILCDGYLSDLLRAIKLGTLPSREKFHELVGLGPMLQRDPFGRILITLIGKGLTANEWVLRSQASGFYFSKWAFDVLALSDYDNRHCLEPGKSYTVVLMRSSELLRVCQEAGRSAMSIDFDYVQSPFVRAELVFLVRELLSNEVMKKLGISRITTLHEPVMTADNSPSVFVSSCLGTEREISIALADGKSLWTDSDAFICPLSS